MYSGMIRVRRAVQAPVSKATAVKALDFRIIRVIRTTMVAIVTRVIKGISSSQAIKVTLSN